MFINCTPHSWIIILLLLCLFEGHDPSLYYLIMFCWWSNAPNLRVSWSVYIGEHANSSSRANLLNSVR